MSWGWIALFALASILLWNGGPGWEGWWPWVRWILVGLIAIHASLGKLARNRSEPPPDAAHAIPGAGHAASDMVHSGRNENLVGDHTQYPLQAPERRMPVTLWPEPPCVDSHTHDWRETSAYFTEGGRVRANDTCGHCGRSRIRNIHHAEGTTVQYPELDA